MTTKLSNFFRKKFYKFSDQLKSKSKLEDINMEQEFAQEMKIFKLKQQEFQKDDGLPIHLKRGKPDKVLFYATMLLSGLGLLHTIGFIYSMAFPSKIETEATNE